MGLVYRTRQFWWALTATPSETGLAQARQILSAGLLELFLQMQPSEQAHSLAVLSRVRQAGQTDRDLWVAALLHDVGKSRHPLRAWERAVVVLAQVLVPRKVEIWGRGEPRGWKRAFVVAQNHAEWGAQMVAACGASPVVVELVRRHQESLPPRPASSVDRLLFHLQVVDNER